MRLVVVMGSGVVISALCRAVQVKEMVALVYTASSLVDGLFQTLSIGAVCGAVQH